MRKILLGVLLLVALGILPVLAHEPVDVGVFNSVISVKTDSSPYITAEVKVQNRAGTPYNIKTYKIDRGEKTITLVDNKLYDADGKLKMADDRRMNWKYSERKIAEQELHDSIYEAVIKWLDDEKKEKKNK